MKKTNPLQQKIQHMGQLLQQLELSIAQLEREQGRVRQCLMVVVKEKAGGM